MVLLAGYRALGDPIWAALSTFAVSGFRGTGLQSPTLGTALGLALSPVAAGVATLWLTALADRALRRRAIGEVQTREDRRLASGGGGWVLLALLTLAIAASWVGDLGVAGRSRPGAVLDGWLSWGWRIASLATVGLLIAGVGQAAGRYSRLTG